MWSARLTAINLFGSCLNSLAAASIAASASGRVDSAEEFGRCSTGRKRRRQIVKGEGVRRRRGAAILSVSTPRCAVCKAGHVSSQGRQRTYPLARFKSALFTTKPAPKKRGATLAATPWFIVLLRDKFSFETGKCYCPFALPYPKSHILLAAIDRRAGQSGDLRDDRETAATSRPHLRRREQPPPPLVEPRADSVPSQPNGGLVDHAIDLPPFAESRNPQHLSQSDAPAADYDSVIVRSVLSRGIRPSGGSTTSDVRAPTCLFDRNTAWL
jgi:hypothetical protein